MDPYACELLKYNLDTQTIAIHDLGKKVPSRWAHCLSLYSIY
jgi:hypothetical protein